MANYDERDVTSRLLLTAKLLGLNDSELARQIGVKKQMIGQMRNNTITAPAKRVVLFLSINEEIDARWMFFGVGEMIIKSLPDGKHTLTLKSPGTMEFTTEATMESSYKEKYKNLQAIVNEKEKYIKVIEKTLDMQSRLFDKFMDSPTKTD